MFVAIAGTDCDAPLAELAAMAAALRGSDRAPRLWREARGLAGFGAAPTGILPEDRFDAQPLSNDSLVFVCEARLDNRAELISRLDIDRWRAVELADSAILALAYERWGEETPQHVYGDFAFVAWQPKSRKLVAATDHIGTIPLFYCQRGERIFLATQLAALMAHPSVPKTLDIAALGLMVAPKLGLGGTMFESIRHLPGGSLLVFHGAKLRCRRWWIPD